MNKKIRFTSSNQKAVYLDKKQRNHLDIFYKGHPLRITCCIENEDFCDLKKVDFDRLTGIRFKQRNSFIFGNLEICLTEVVFVNIMAEVEMFEVS